MPATSTPENSERLKSIARRLFEDDSVRGTFSSGGTGEKDAAIPTADQALNAIRRRLGSGDPVEYRHPVITAARRYVGGEISAAEAASEFAIYSDLFHRQAVKKGGADGTALDATASMLDEFGRLAKPPASLVENGTYALPASAREVL